MTTIRVKENEPFDVALRRFKRTIEKLGLLTDLRAREFYEKPTAERKRKSAFAPCSYPKSCTDTPQPPRGCFSRKKARRGRSGGLFLWAYHLETKEISQCHSKIKSRKI